MNTDNFVKHYLICALWSSTDNNEPLDTNYGLSDFAQKTIDKAKQDCQNFIDKAGNLLNDWTEEQAGHDFWLTRNRHGSGFWDRDFPNGKELTTLAHQFGECDIYVGDDGMLHF
jgi:hypothetical protein